MTRYSRLVRVCSFLAAAGGGFLLTACGGKGDVETNLVPVSGKVTVNNVPVTTGQIMYYPNAAKNNSGKKVPSGTIEPDGTYKLKTASGGKVVDGAPPGWYKVTVSPNGAPQEFPGKEKKSPIFNTDYNSEKNTKLEIEVKEGAPAGAYDLKLRP